MDNEKRFVTLRVKRGIVDLEIEQSFDGTISVYDNVTDRCVMDLHVSDLQLFLSLICAGGTNGND